MPGALEAARAAVVDLRQARGQVAGRLAVAIALEAEIDDRDLDALAVDAGAVPRRGPGRPDAFAVNRIGDRPQR
jgi:hypothetical protein